MKLLLTALASSALALIAASADTSNVALARSKNNGRSRVGMPSSHRVVAGGVSASRALDDNAKQIWEQTKTLKSAKVPSGYLSTLGAPVSVQTQVVAGINYRFTFKDGMQVTVNSTPWRTPSLNIVGVTHAKAPNKKGSKPSNVAGLHLTQTQRNRALQEFKKQDANNDGAIPNGAAYSALMNLEGKEEQAKHTCPGWEEVTQQIVGKNPHKKVRIDDFMRKYTDFEVARRGMKYFSSFAGKDCVLTGHELQTALQKTFGNDVTKDQVKQLIHKYSQDKNPNISFSEFYQMYKDYEHDNSDNPTQGKGTVDDKGTLNGKETSVVEKAWNGLDTSRDGYVQNSEFSRKYRAIVSTMNKDGKGTQTLLKQLDDYFKYFAGKDGKLSHVEYLKMMEVMKSKVGGKTFDQFLVALTKKNCGQLHDCYKCVSADLACAWMPVPKQNGGAYRTPRKTDGACIPSKMASFLGSQLLRGAPVTAGSLTTVSQCGKKYDAQPHIFD